MPLDADVQGETQPDTTAQWDLPKLIMTFGRFYDIFPAGQVLCAYPEGHDRPPLRAMTPAGLAEKILDELDPSRAAIPHARQAQ